ncbi:MAG: heme o synthase [Pyrinomonadaceae bacterium]
METVFEETAEPKQEKALSFKEKISAYIELTKPRIAFMLVLTAAAGFYMGSGSGFDVGTFFNSMAAITLLAFGVAAINQFIERDIDKLMERTENRPIPSGRVSPAEALIFGVSLCVIAEVYLWLAVNPLTAVLGISVIVGYDFLYTPLKTRTTASTAIGAIPGAMPPLMGWTAAAGFISLPALFLFALLFFWQFPHFLAIAWMYKDQYAKAGIKMLPVVEPDGRITARQIVIFTLFLLPISVAPYFLGLSGKIFLVGASVLGIWFLYVSVRTARARTVEMARKLLFASVLYLPIVFLLMVIDR